jgi:hypothetical protein
MAGLRSDFGKGYNSFSGVDIKGVFGNTVVAELQAISYSITREKAPIYTMGSADPRSFSRGKRGIAGTLIFIMFDRHALLGTFGVYGSPDSQLFFLSDIDDFRPDPGQSSGSNVTITGGITAGEGSVNAPGGTSNQLESPLTHIDDDQEVIAPWFVDQMPPIDVTLAAANEYGSLAVMRIFGIELMNEGYGVSIDDIVSEQQFTYIARTLVGWRPLGRTAKMTAAGTPSSS